MEIKGFPPNIDEIRRYLTPRPKTVFAYRGNIYNPSGEPMDSALIAHENKHLEQQMGDPDGWWSQYLINQDFRFSQEKEAYQAQYQKAKELIKDRNLLAKYSMLLAKDLSSEMYGNCVEFQVALKAIKS